MWLWEFNNFKQSYDAKCITYAGPNFGPKNSSIKMQNLPTYTKSEYKRKEVVSMLLII